MLSADVASFKLTTQDKNNLDCKMVTDVNQLSRRTPFSLERGSRKGEKEEEEEEREEEGKRVLLQHPLFSTF